MTDADRASILWSPEDTAIVHAHAAEVLNPLRQEMLAATLAVEFRQMCVLRGLGLPAATLFADGLIGATVASVDKEDRWQPDEGGRALLVTPSIEGGVITDLIAFDPRQPDHWFLRSGNGWALGADDILTAREGWPGTPPLTLHATPLDYLRAGATGAAVVEWTAQARQALLQVDRIDVADPKFAQRLRLELARPPRMPQIAVPRRQQHDAA